jgi:hypothetical protein
VDGEPDVDEELRRVADAAVREPAAAP